MLKRWSLLCVVCLLLALLALSAACGSSGTLVRLDGGPGDARAEASDGGADSTAPPDSGGVDSTVPADTSPPADTSAPDTSAPDTSAPDTSAPDTSIDAPADTTPLTDTASPGDTSQPDTSPVPTFTVGGTITGTGGQGVTLQDNGGDSVTVSMDGAFTFPTPLASGAAFNVTVLSPPGESCNVAGGSGTVGGGNVTTVIVTCLPIIGVQFLGGTVTGLAGTGLVLENNGGDAVTISSNGEFMFPTPPPSGGTYSVSVATQPTSPVQVCTVTNGTGTFPAGMNVTNVAVTCVPTTFTVSVTITGLSGTIVLADNGTDMLTETTNGSFTFPTSLGNGASYVVTVKTQPLVESCAVSGGSGTVSGADVTTVVVNCMPGPILTIGGVISGLAPGDSVQLELNGADATFFGQNGNFAFSMSLGMGATYAVAAKSNPATPTAQTCTILNGMGTVGAMNVNSVEVDCVTNSYTIGGAVTLAGTGSDAITLRDNGGDDLVIQPGTTSPAHFTFATPILSGSSYSVAAFATGGTAITCTAKPVGTMFQGVVATSLAAGTVGSQNVTGILIECAP